METPDMWYLRETSDCALDRSYHDSMVSTSVLGAQKILSRLFASGQKSETTTSGTWGSELSGRRVGKVILAIKSSVRAFRKYIHVGGFRQLMLTIECPDSPDFDKK